MRVINNFNQKAIGLIALLVLLILYYLIINSIVNFDNSSFYVIYDRFSWIEFVSIVYVVVLLFLSLWKFEWYFYGLIFAILVLPASFNNIIPSVLITAKDDYTTVFFPLVTHLDIFLILGFFRYIFFPKFKFNSLANITTVYLIALVVLLFVVLSINLYKFRNNPHDFILILSHSYHLRYICLLIIFFMCTDVLNYFKKINFVFALAVLFLIAESFLYSSLFSDGSRLVSGNFGNNVYGNLLAGVFCYFLYLLLRKKIANTYFVFLVLVFISIYLTTTRSSLYLVFLYVIFESFYIGFKFLRNRNGKLKIKKRFIFVLILIFSFFLLLKNNRTDFTNFSVNEINFEKSELQDIIVLDDNSFNASLAMRLNHFNTSLNMIKESPLTGIGAGRWNVHKAKYGSIDNHLMDSHNDFFATISQYGFIAGLMLLINVYLAPLFIYFKNRKRLTIHIILFNVIVMITGITNSNLFKHQLYFLLTLFSFYYLFKLSNNEDSLTRN